MKLAPIVLFVYNRFDHTVQTISALKNNNLANESKLIVFSDGSKEKKDLKEIQKIRDYLKNITGFKSIEVIEREENIGLAKSVINGVSEIINKYEKVIVLEDDIVTSKDFLEYMNNALYFYENTEKIFSITGLNFPINIPTNYDKDVYIFYRCSSWGWATWKDRWIKADWEVSDYNIFISNKSEVKRFNLAGDDQTDMLTAQLKNKINSWAIRWGYAHFKHNAYCLYPIASKVENIGMDNTGTHCTEETKKLFSKAVEKKINFTHDLELNESIVKSYQGLFKYTIKDKLKQFVKKLIGYYKI